MALQIRDEFIHRLFIGPVEADVVVVVDGNGIDQDVLAAQETGQFLGAGVSTSQALDEDVFKGDLPASDIEIVAGRLQDFVEGIFLGNRHDAAPQGIVRRVEGYGQVMGMPSLARSYILGTMPDVDKAMLR